MAKGIFIGRFQPFHKGHLEAVKHCLKHCNELTIIIGSPRKEHEADNPFTLRERTKMVRLGVGEKNLKRISITSVDDENNDDKWTRKIEKHKFDTVFTNNDVVKECLKEHEIKEIPIIYNTNATEVRRKMYLNQNWKECVPKKVGEYLQKIKAQQRIKKILG